MSDFDNFIYIIAFGFWLFSRSAIGEAGGILIFALALCIEYGVFKC